MLKYYSIYKPYGMLSQFTSEGGHPTLKDLGANFPSDVYPVGRLDTDSEGLLVLTNDTTLNNRLLDPKRKHYRTYFVQVEGLVTEEAIKLLEEGPVISVDGKQYKCLSCKAESIQPEIPERNPPIRFRKSIPTSWIKLNLIEGKNRQVRKMAAKVGFPVLRLIRVSIENLHIDDYVPGTVKEWERMSLLKLLKL